MKRDNHKKSPEELVLISDVIIRNAKRLKQLTDNILDVTKIESHSFKLNKERLDIVQLIEDVIVDQNILISNTLKRESGLEILCKVSDYQMKDFATIDTAAETVSNSMNAIRAYKSAGDNDSDKPNPPSESYLVEADRA